MNMSDVQLTCELIRAVFAARFFCTRKTIDLQRSMLCSKQIMDGGHHSQVDIYGLAAFFADP